MNLYIPPDTTPDRLEAVMDELRRDAERRREDEDEPDDTITGAFARLVGGRVSSLRGVAAVGVVGGIVVGFWPLLSWRCRTRPGLAASVAMSLFAWPLMFWGCIMFNANKRIELIPHKPGAEPWYRRRVSKN